VNKTYRDLVFMAQTWERAGDFKAAVTAWLSAVDACPRYDQTNRELCGERAMRAFNAAYTEPADTPVEMRQDSCWPLSVDVFYWPGARDGEGKRGRTRGAAYMLCGTAMIGIEGVSGGIALSHVLVISE